MLKLLDNSRNLDDFIFSMSQHNVFSKLYDIEDIFIDHNHYALFTLNQEKLRSLSITGVYPIVMLIDDDLSIVSVGRKHETEKAITSVKDFKALLDPTKLNSLSSIYVHEHIPSDHEFILSKLPIVNRGDKPQAVLLEKIPNKPWTVEIVKDDSSELAAYFKSKLGVRLEDVIIKAPQSCNLVFRMYERVPTLTNVVNGISCAENYLPEVNKIANLIGLDQLDFRIVINAPERLLSFLNEQALNTDKIAITRYTSFENYEKIASTRRVRFDTSVFNIADVISALTTTKVVLDDNKKDSTDDSGDAMFLLRFFIKSIMYGYSPEIRSKLTSFSDVISLFEEDISHRIKEADELYQVAKQTSDAKSFHLAISKNPLSSFLTTIYAKRITKVRINYLAGCFTPRSLVKILLPDEDDLNTVLLTITNTLSELKEDEKTYLKTLSKSF